MTHRNPNDPIDPTNPDYKGDTYGASNPADRARFDATSSDRIGHGEPIDETRVHDGRVAPHETTRTTTETRPATTTTTDGSTVIREEDNGGGWWKWLLGLLALLLLGWLIWALASGNNDDANSEPATTVVGTTTVDVTTTVEAPAEGDAPAEGEPAPAEGEPAPAN